MSLQFYQVRTQHEKDALLDFYAAEKEKINRQDLQNIYVLQEDDVIVAALKVEAVKHDNSWFMRNVLVAEQSRGEGLSKHLIQQCLLVLNDKPCFCLAYEYLAPLYQQCGFSEVDVDQTADLYKRRYKRAQKKAIAAPDKAVVLMTTY